MVVSYSTKLLEYLLPDFKTTLRAYPKIPFQRLYPALIPAIIISELWKINIGISFWAWFYQFCRKRTLIPKSCELTNISLYAIRHHAIRHLVNSISA